MVRIFIIYGGQEGRIIGTTINEYYKKNGLNSFLASRNSPDMIAGKDFDPQIDDNLVNADIAIVIITSGLKHSPAAMDEIQQIQDLHIPFIPYEVENSEVPIELQTLHRLPLDPENFNEKELIHSELNMWRTLDILKISPTKTTEITPTTKRIEVPYIG